MINTSVSFFSSQDFPKERFGCTTAPFLKEFLSGRESRPTTDIRVARCGHCNGYINKFCDTTNGRWFCSLCGYRNTFSKQQSRYRQVDLRLLPEIQDTCADFRMFMSTGAPYHVLSSRPIVHLFFVQESMDFDSLQATVEAISATILNMHSQLRFALVTFSKRIGIYRFCRFGATVQYLDFTLDGSLSTLVSMAEVVQFMDVCSEVSLCRDSFLAGVTSLIDSFSTNTSDAASPNSSNMLGPCLAALEDWLLKPSRVNSNISSLDPFAGEDEDLQRSLPLSSWSGGLLNFFGVGSQDSSEKDTLLADSSSAASSCTGIFIHMFLDSSQDTFEGTHRSLTENISAENKQAPPRRRLNNRWIKELSSRFAHNAVTVNIWAISNFGKVDLALCDLEPLASLTGGAIHRYVLGMYPKDERIRLSESLCRVVCSRYATAAILKLRTSTGVSVIPGGHSGPMVPDCKYDGIFRLASCSPESTIGFELQLDDSSVENVCLQVAFTFETLIESDLTMEDAAPSKTVAEQTPDTNENEYPDNFTYDELESDLKFSAPHEVADKDGQSYTNSVLGILELDKESMEHNGQLISFGRDVIYNPRKQLIVIKVLRIITVILQSDKKFSSSSFPGRFNVPTTIALIIRTAASGSKSYDLTCEASRASSEPVDGNGNEATITILNTENPGVRYILNWAASFLSQALTAQRDEENDLRTDMSLRITAVLKIYQVEEVIRLLFAAVDLITFHSRSSPSSSRASPDESAVFYNLCQRLDAIRLCNMLYPQLWPITRDHIVSPRPIRLSRQSMVIDSSPFYLLDAGTELIFYQARLQDNRFVSNIEPTPLPIAPAVIAEADSSPRLGRRKSSKIGGDRRSAEESVNSSVSRSQSLMAMLSCRLSASTCPPVVTRAVAGFGSASSFDSYLLEDISRAGITYADFKKLLVDMISVSEGISDRR